MTKECLRYEPAYTETSQSEQAGQLNAAAAGTGCQYVMSNVVSSFRGAASESSLESCYSFYEHAQGRPDMAWLIGVYVLQVLCCMAFWKAP
jgi:hypothetical protein